MKGLISLLLVLLLSSLVLSQSIEEASRVRIVGSVNNEFIAVLSDDYNQNNFIQKKELANNQLEELGSRFGGARSDAQLEELGSRFGGARSDAQLEELGSRFGGARSDAQLEELGSRFGGARSNAQLEELGSRFGGAR